MYLVISQFGDKHQIVKPSELRSKKRKGGGCNLRLKIWLTFSEEAFYKNLQALRLRKQADILPHA